jgi:transaldolase
MTTLTAASLRVKLFADGASLPAMKKMAADPRIRGFTTNPTLMRVAGVTDYGAFAREAIAAIPDRPISFEVLADSLDTFARQARTIATWGENVYVKVPVMTTDRIPTYDVVRDLARDGVKVNVTAVFTIEQVEEVCTALAGGPPSVVSVFAGRIADAGVDPVPHMRQCLAICRSADPRIELLWASPRELFNVVQAHEVGVDIITATDAILSKLDQLGKDLHEFSRETVLMFKNDGEKAGYQI